MCSVQLDERMKRAGFCGTPFSRTSKCRCGPVERPVDPTMRDALATHHEVSFVHEDLRRMCINGHQSVTVIDLDDFTILRVPSRRDDLAAGGGHDVALPGSPGSRCLRGKIAIR